MEITIKGDPKEIAALVVALQERQEVDKVADDVIRKIVDQSSNRIKDACSKI